LPITDILLLLKDLNLICSTEVINTYYDKGHNYLDKKYTAGQQRYVVVKVGQCSMHYTDAFCGRNYV
jgi:hypothetical protein